MKAADTLLFEEIERLKILCEYLSLDLENTIHVKINGTSELIRMNSNFRFEHLTSNGWEDYTDAMTVPAIIQISYLLEKEPCVEVLNHANRWEEIYATTIVETILKKYYKGGHI